MSLNAPSGAQCFPTGVLNKVKTAVAQSQCTFWCSVLSDMNVIIGDEECSVLSQCTFWCSVLSDRKGESPKGKEPKVSMHLLVLSAFRRKVQQ